ncbi:MAG: translation elongation factor 4, partial [Planctomycetaceae bacterium]
MSQELIRNFSIIAHIDHGKSTLADQLLLRTGAITEREFKEQLLDDLDVERERGITVKARAVAIDYTPTAERWATLAAQLKSAVKPHGVTKPNQPPKFQLNLIDTPGHVDFHYEVSRSLAACEGALLLVDAFQGVQAQTVANAFAAIEAGLEIIPVINKIDLPVTRIDQVLDEIETVIGLDATDALMVSAKKGIGIEEVFEAIIARIPPPKGDPSAPLQALVFDSKYDNFRGVVTYARIMEGTLRKGDRIRFMKAGTVHDTLEIGRFRPQMEPCTALGPGQTGYVITGVKEVAHVHVGDTLTLQSTPAKAPLPGYKQPQQMVFCGMYPIDATDFEKLREELERMSLNDASFSYSPETSDALGFGFRCGFLGLLHMEIIQQRLEKEADVDLIQTAPNVTYEIEKRNSGEVLHIDNPVDVPDAGDIEEFREPIARVNFILPSSNIGSIMQLCEERRGIYKATEYLGPDRAQLIYELPLAEIIYDMHDKLKSATRGYGTMDYDVIGFRPADLVKMDILVKGVKVEALATIVFRDFAERRGRQLVKRLKKEISKHQFEIALQAAIGSRVIARETISALRKNVTAK